MKMRVILLSFLVLFSHGLLTALPMDRGPSQSRQESGDREPPRRRPLRPRNSKNRQESSKNKSSFQKNKSESQKDKSTPQVPEAQENKNPAISLDESSEQIKSEDFINYRGNRVFLSNDEFLLQEIRTERLSEFSITLEITFNQSINPRSFDYSSIKINGMDISPDTTFSFNKKGDTIKLTIPVKTQVFSLEIKDIESFDGTAINPIEIRGISDNSINEDISNKI